MIRYGLAIALNFKFEYLLRAYLIQGELQFGK